MDIRRMHEGDTVRCVTVLMDNFTEGAEYIAPFDGALIDDTGTIANHSWCIFTCVEETELERWYYDADANEYS